MAYVQCTICMHDQINAMKQSPKHDEELLGFFDVCVEEGENNPLLLCEAFYTIMRSCLRKVDQNIL